MLDLESLYALQSHVENYTKKDPLHSLHQKQKEFVLDNSPRLTGDWGRRAGKTTAVGMKIVIKAQECPAQGTDDSIIGFLSTTKTHAENLMWGRLKSLNAIYKLGITFHGTKLKATFPNGCQVWILGADKQHDWDKLRGFAYRMIIIDEAQAIRGTVSTLIDETLDPALGDYDGQLVLTGTPGAACTGFFYEAATGQLPEWKNYHGTVLDNPFFPMWRGKPDWRERAQRWLERKRKAKGWTEDHPSYMREWLGRWVRDEAGLVYKFHRERNTYTGRLPEGHDWSCVMGVDLGFDDPFSMQLWKFSESHPNLYDGGSFSKSGLTVSDCAELIREWMEQHRPQRIVVDSGALGKQIVKEMCERHALPLHPAEKSSKMDYINLMNADFVAGKIKVKEGSPYAEQLELLQFDQSGRLKEDDAFRNDICDAGLYAWREAQHWIDRPKEHVPDVGTQDWLDKEASRLRLKRERNQLKKRKRRF